MEVAGFRRTLGFALGILIINFSSMLMAVGFALAMSAYAALLYGSAGEYQAAPDG